jgi:hypothetical protein
MRDIKIELEPVMSQATAAERAWRNGRIAERIIDHGQRSDWREAELRIKLATMWAAVAGQFEFVTEVATAEGVWNPDDRAADGDLGDTDCLRIAPEAEYCPAAGSPRCVGCVWRPADNAPTTASACVNPDHEHFPGDRVLSSCIGTTALTEQTAVVPTVLPQRDPGATLSMPVPLCYCPSGAPYGHVFGSACT